MSVLRLNPDLPPMALGCLLPGTILEALGMWGDRHSVKVPYRLAFKEPQSRLAALPALGNLCVRHPKGKHDQLRSLGSPMAERLRERRRLPGLDPAARDWRRPGSVGS